MMAKHVSQIAIDNLTELALYSPECAFGNVCDDELYNLLHEGSGGYYDEDSYGYMEALTDPVFRRMYFFFMAEMLKTPWYPQPAVTVKTYQLHKPVSTHIAAMANAVLHQLETGDTDRDTVRAVCQWVSVQRKTELCQG